jgi:hypothetical protein
MRRRPSRGTGPAPRISSGQSISDHRARFGDLAALPAPDLRRHPQRRGPWLEANRGSSLHDVVSAAPPGPKRRKILTATARRK